MNIKNCRICEHEITRQITIREMQLGLREDFSYGVCSHCGCIQIMEVPAQIEKYYPAYYAPFNKKAPLLRKLTLFKRWVKNIRVRRKYKQGSNLVLNYLGPINISTDARILDIGCGNGVLICNLYNQGFYHVEGVDRFIPQEINYGHGVKVVKKDLSEFKSKNYDVLMMHHVLEHIENQAGVLKECHRLLKDDGRLLIRVPILGEAYKIYSENWVQLDAPRHFFIHTLMSMNILAQKTGFRVHQVVFDSGSFQFTGSEMYKRDIPLYDPISQKPNAVEQYFSKEEIDDFEKQAEKLNENGTGDQAMFYLTKV